jgi:hypothetical protein
LEQGTVTFCITAQPQQGVRIDIRNSSKEFGFFRGILDILDKKSTMHTRLNVTHGFFQA